MRAGRHFERLLRWAKALERRFYHSDYEDLRLRSQGIRADGAGLYGEKVYRPLPDPGSVRSLLVFKPDDMGDAILALPALGRLRDRFPNARLTVLCQPANRAIFERVPGIDELICVDVRIWGLRFRSLDLKQALAKLPQGRFDVSIFLRTYPAYFRDFLKIPSAHPVHPVDPRLPSKAIAGAQVSQWGDRRRHQALQLLEVAGFATGEEYGAEHVRFPEFRWNETDLRAPVIAFSNGRPDRYAVAHPFANFETRRYPYWSELLQKVERRFGLPVYTVGGPEDGVLEGFPRERQLQGKLTLGQSGFFLSGASAFLGNHSGPAHWAAALGVPTVAIFSGHSLASEWGPVGKTLILSLEAACSPCHSRFCHGYGLKCLTELPAYRVLPDVEKFLDGHLRPRPFVPPPTRSPESILI